MDFCWAEIGPQGTTALASALTLRALPSLKKLQLAGNKIGDAGLTAMVPALRQLPTLTKLLLSDTSIGDQGVASLVAQPLAGAFQSLEALWLGGSQMTDAGCTTLASALRAGALPAIEDLRMDPLTPS